MTSSPVAELNYPVLESVLGRLASARLTLTLNDSGGLRLTPKERVTDPILALVRSHREDLVALVRQRDAAVTVVRQRTTPRDSPGNNTPPLPPVGKGGVAELSHQREPDNGLRVPLTIHSAVLGEDIVLAPDGYPVPPLWNGRVVYRHSEAEKGIYPAEDPQALQLYHPNKRFLLTAWMEIAPTGWVAAFRPKKADADIITLEAIGKAAGLPRHVAEASAVQLVAGGVLGEWVPMIDGLTRYRLLRPDIEMETDVQWWEEREALRVRAEVQRKDSNISREISDGETDDFGEKESSS